jgi:hypothetical protein
LPRIAQPKQQSNNPRRCQLMWRLVVYSPSFGGKAKNEHKFRYLGVPKELATGSRVAGIQIHTVTSAPSGFWTRPAAWLKLIRSAGLCCGPFRRGATRSPT